MAKPVAQPAPPAPVAKSEAPLLQVTDLKKHFPIHRGVFSRVAGYVNAVDGVSFTVRRGRTLGLVGESGCGKTTAGRTILRLIPATSGQVIFDGNDVFNTPSGPLRELRRRMQIIFQDPVGSLNPRMTVETIVGESRTVHGIARGQQRRERVAELLARCGLRHEQMNRYPHEFSGGQRQRIGIARALALDPDFIVCDEPVSALDVSIQSQVLNLLSDLQEERGLSFLFIAHDMAVIEHISHDVAVMYLGRIVESAPKAALFSRPLHPYTQALLSAVPVPEVGAKKNRQILTGEVPSPINPPPGCHFHARCPIMMKDICPLQYPPLLPHPKNPDHLCACWAVQQGRE